MLKVVVVVFERAPCVVRRINTNALHLPAVEGQKCSQREKVVAMDDQVFGRRITVRSGVLENMERDVLGLVAGVLVVDP